ncbi:uncharacterized protein LOC128883323 [Hylaeus volcanicus]|uniref:uncharacterized protein LOC128883323 n=1 Tax=Hylaeus volcanicus TaxID=313075 RepID=UPI0023B7FC9B|nr:uncharacterized protein LOC128883323 [Hylaeus volcanicus]
MKDITILWDQAIKEWPKLVYDVMTVCSCLMSFCCENVWKKDKKHALMGNACDFLKGKMMTDTAQYFIGKIGWSLSCLSDTSVEFHETILENITVLKISLRVLTCTLLLSYESLDSETLNERLLLVMETCMNYCFKKNATYVAWCTDWFQCIEASMNYMYLFHFVQEPEEDHSKTLSSCLFLLTHFFSLHTKWIQNETLCLTDCVFLPHCIEYLSYCLTYFLQDTGQLFLQSILAALQECFLNIQAAINFCQKLDLMQTKLWIQAFTKLCTCIQKCWETKFHNFFDSIHENDIVNEQHSKICLALTRLYSLLVHAAKHWTDFQHIQKSLWALLFCIRYPLFKWPFLQDSSLMFQLTHCKKLEQLEKQQLCLQPMDSTDTFQYTMTLRKKCLDSLFESFESIENKNHDISSNSFKALATCLFLFLGQDIAKEILTCPNIVVGALKQTMDQRTCRFNHDITWEQLLRHLYVWFLVLKEFQSNSADSAELSQYHASLFLHIPFSSLNVSECWFNQLRDSLCQVPSLYSSWDNIVQFHEQVSITRDDITCLIAQPNNLLQALIDLLSLLVLLEDEIPNCFSCEKKEPQSAKGLQACQWKISETCDQFLSSFKTFPLTCYRENNPPLFKNQNWVSWNMPSIIQDGSTQIENFWNEDSSRYLEHIPNFFKESSETWHQVWIFSIQLLYVVAQMFPIALRMYACSLQSVWMTTKHVKALHDIFQKIISPSLILRDAASICALEKIGTTNVKASVQFNKKLRQLCLTFINNTREILVTFTVHFPDIYPLRCVDFKYNKSVAVPKPKLERWLLMAKQILMGGRISKPTSPESSHQSCSQFDLRHLSFKQYAHEPHTICLLSCITFIKDNFAAFVLGLEDCFICYSIVHHRTRGIPKSQCVTCKYKFHAECVQKWFETSLKNNCPLCQSPFS